MFGLWICGEEKRMKKIVKEHYMKEAKFGSFSSSIRKMKKLNNQYL